MTTTRSAQSLALKQHASDIVAQWETGALSYQDAINQLFALKGEASGDGRIQDEAFLESRIGVIEGGRGNYATGIAHYENARDLYMQAGDQRQAVVCSVNIGQTYRLKGNLSRARQYFRIGYEAALALGDRELQVLARANESQMLMSQGHTAMAEASLRECYELCEEPFPVPLDSTLDATARNQLGQKTDIAQALATICLEQGRVVEAWRFAKEAYELAHLLKSDLRLGFAYRAIGEVVHAVGSAPESPFESDPDVYFTESAARFKAVKAEGEMARTLSMQGRSLGQRGRSTLAARKLHQAMILFSRLGMVDDAARAAEEQLKLV